MKWASLGLPQMLLYIFFYVNIHTDETAVTVSATDNNKNVNVLETVANRSAYITTMQHQ